jgi:hypothetical protein
MSSPPIVIVPAVALLEPGDHPQRRRLAAAGGAEEREELARRHLEVEVVDGGEAAEPLGDPRQGEVCARTRSVGHRHAPITSANICWYFCSVLVSSDMKS